MTKSIHLWTDGSSINSGENVGCGGHGYVLLYGDFEGVDIKTEYCDEKFILKGYGSAKEKTTNQREELKAVVEGLKKIKDPSVPIEIFSDSAYFINCMNDKWYANWRTNGWKNSKKQAVVNQDIWEEMLDVIESNMMFIKYNKVKGHSGIFYNEMCDKLAGQGLDESRGRA